MKYVTFNQNYLNDIIISDSDYKQAIENHRLIPKVDDNGNINGTILLFNCCQSQYGLCKITGDLNKIMKIYPEQQAKYQLINQHFFIIDSSTLCGVQGYTLDGIYHSIDQQLITEQKRFGHFYDIIDLSDHEIDGTNSIQTGMSLMSIQEQYNMSISTVTLNPKAVESLSNNQLMNWLYYFSKYLLTTRLIKMTDLSLDFQIDEQIQFLQPLMILGGKSILSLKRKHVQIKDIQNLLSNECKSNELYKNSIIDIASLNNERFFESFEASQQFEYQSEVFTKTSIIQCLIEARKQKEIIYFIRESLKHKNLKIIKNILIQDLPMIIEYQKIEFNEFLKIQIIENSLSDKKGQNKFDFENHKLEQILSDQNLKTFGSNIKIWKAQQFDGKSRMEEIIQIINKDRIDEDQVQVQYSIISFEETERKIQIDYFNQRNSEFCKFLYDQFKLQKKLNFSQLFLARILNQAKNIVNFYQQNTIQKIIDIQFEKSKIFIKIQLYVYLIGFIIPYLYVCISQIQSQDQQGQNLYAKWTLYSICSIIQILFVILELPEIYYNGFLKYIKDNYNKIDLLVPIFYFIHLGVRIGKGKPESYDWRRLLDNLVEIIIVVGSVIKMIQFLNYKEEFAQVVQMFFQVVKDLKSFLLMFFSFVSTFTMIQYILSGQAKDDDYPGVHPIIRMFIQIFRQSVGDINPIDYSNWADNSNVKGNYTFSSPSQEFVVYEIWGFWHLNLVLIQIIMLNLLIAQVGQIYDKVMHQGKTTSYKEKAELNMKIYEQLYFFGQKNEFNALITQYPIENEDSNENDFPSFSQRINHTTIDCVNKMENRISNKIADMHYKITYMDTKIANIESKIDKEIFSIKEMIQQVLNENQKEMNKGKDLNA